MKVTDTKQNFYLKPYYFDKKCRLRNNESIIYKKDCFTSKLEIIKIKCY